MAIIDASNIENFKKYLDHISSLVTSNIRSETSPYTGSQNLDNVYFPINGLIFDSKCSIRVRRNLDGTNDNRYAIVFNDYEIPLAQINNFGAILNSDNIWGVSQSGGAASAGDAGIPNFENWMQSQKPTRRLPQPPARNKSGPAISRASGIGGTVVDSSLVRRRLPKPPARRVSVSNEESIFNDFVAQIRGMIQNREHINFKCDFARDNRMSVAFQQNTLNIIFTYPQGSVRVSQVNGGAIEIIESERGAAALPKIYKIAEFVNTDSYGKIKEHFSQALANFNSNLQSQPVPMEVYPNQVPVPPLPPRSSAWAQAPAPAPAPASPPAPPLPPRLAAAPASISESEVREYFNLYFSGLALSITEQFRQFQIDPASGLQIGNFGMSTGAQNTNKFYIERGREKLSIDYSNPQGIFRYSQNNVEGTLEQAQQFLLDAIQDLRSGGLFAVPKEYDARYIIRQAGLARASDFPSLPPRAAAAANPPQAAAAYGTNPVPPLPHQFSAPSSLRNLLSQINASQAPQDAIKNACTIYGNQLEIEQDLKSATLTVNEEIAALMREHIAITMNYGTKIEKDCYKKQLGIPDKLGLYSSGDITPQQINNFIQRLVNKRPLKFIGGQDSSILRDGEQGNGHHFDFSNLHNISPQNGEFCFENYISYDEMKFSAFVNGCVHTKFLNKGDRDNQGKIVRDDTVVKEGYVIGAVGARFERRGLMEDADIIVRRDKDRNALPPQGPRYDYSVANAKLWARFYQGQDRYPTFDEASTQVQKFHTEYGESFDIKAYKKRIKLSYKAVLDQANNVASSLKPAYVHLCGLGTGAWAKNTELQEHCIIEAVKEILQENAYPNIGIIDFSWFSRDQESFEVNGKKCYITRNDPASKDKKCRGGAIAADLDRFTTVQLVAWDSNSFPGNEFWGGSMTASGDPAAACSAPMFAFGLNEATNPYLRGAEIRRVPPIRDMAMAQPVPAAAAAVNNAQAGVAPQFSGPARVFPATNSALAPQAKSPKTIKIKVLYPMASKATGWRNREGNEIIKLYDDQELLGNLGLLASSQALKGSDTLAIADFCTIVTRLQGTQKRITDQVPEYVDNGLITKSNGHNIGKIFEDRLKDLHVIVSNINKYQGEAAKDIQVVQEKLNWLMTQASGLCSLGEVEIEIAEKEYSKVASDSFIMYRARNGELCLKFPDKEQRDAALSKFKLHVVDDHIIQQGGAQFSVGNNDFGTIPSVLDGRDDCIFFSTVGNKIDFGSDRNLAAFAELIGQNSAGREFKCGDKVIARRTWLNTEIELTGRVAFADKTSTESYHFIKDDNGVVEGIGLSSRPQASGGQIAPQRDPSIDIHILENRGHYRNQIANDRFHDNALTQINALQQVVQQGAAQQASSGPAAHPSNPFIGASLGHQSGGRFGPSAV